MNRISGQLVVRESGVGIPGLLVVVYDVDPDTTPEEYIEALGAEGDRRTDGDRIGSVLTGRDGTFELVFEEGEFRIRNEGERRPDLLLSVLAPEEPELDGRLRVLHVSPQIRQNAGRTEQYLVRISVEHLQKAGLPVPTAAEENPEGSKSVLERLKARETRRGEIDTGLIEVARERMQTHRERVAGFEQQLRPELDAALSKVSPAIEPARVVGPDESVFTKSTDVMKRTLHEVVNASDPSARPRVRGRLTLTREQADQLRQDADADGYVAEEIVRERIGRDDDGGPVVARAASVGRCGPRNEHERATAAVLDPPAEPTEPTPAVGDGVEVVGSSDMPRYIARIVDTMTSPEEDLLTGLMPVATLQSVRRNVEKLSLEPSPADVPSFHDVHSLQIAFEHVWQEAIDEAVLDLAESLYSDIVELGGEVRTAPGRDALGSLRASALEALRAHRVVVRDHRGQPPVLPPPIRSGGGGVTVTSGDQVRDHRRSPGASPVRDHRVVPGGDGAATGAVERLPRLLVELERRLRENYAFTTYAANAKERSVNFALLLTYRQTLTPLNYQAGKLVKTIPLAPNQSQKLVVTRRTHKKRSVKEMEKNLRALREETTHTSRAEQEIIRRAAAKTTFSYANEATSGVEVAEAKTSTSLTREAQKSSDDIKKSMRESIVKAAMEVSRELVKEVTTEETTDFESVETTELYNKNQEVSVTFLLYDLERVCRVSEDLHRVQPVVLVAQEMPKPHEIDQDWLLTHDWILKRAILDDSFLPALESLAQSAGNETALVEMRTNVQQQRRIVDELREELTTARQRATLQKSLIERSLYQRVGGAKKEDGGLFGFVGDAVDAVTDLGSDVAGIAAEVGSQILGGGEGQENNRGAFEDAAERAADEARDLMFRLEREVTALNALTESYTKALREHHTHLTEIARLEVHVRQNILYYMQQIWTHEPPDQRFFRLHEVPVPVLKPRRRAMRINFDEPEPAPTLLPHESLARFGGLDVMAYRYESAVEVEDDQLDFEPLAKVADIATLIGFTGNCMMFRLFESNALTEFMMDPYVDRATGELLDPAGPERFTLDEFSDYVHCLKEELTAEEFEELRPTLKVQYERLLTASRRSDDVIVVPTDSLFIEALPATETLLEPHLRLQRTMEVKQAQERVRAEALENVRRASRLLVGEREDPNIDKRILVDGTPGVVVDPENP